MKRIEFIEDDTGAVTLQVLTDPATGKVMYRHRAVARLRHRNEVHTKPFVVVFEAETPQAALELLPAIREAANRKAQEGLRSDLTRRELMGLDRPPPRNGGGKHR